MPQKPTYEHAGEAGGRENDQNLRQQEEKKKPDSEPYQQNPQHHAGGRPRKPTSSITIELWRPPASLPLAASSSRYTGTLFL